jgi:predicted DNA-binding transcriptional regulator YafY
MTKRPNTQETLIFALELLRRIPRKRKISAAQLHQQLKDAGFDKGIRTVQRQLETLSDHFGIEIDKREKPYGYCWNNQSKGLSLPALNEQDSLLLTLAEDYLRNLLPANLMSSMEGFFDQAKYNLHSQYDSKNQGQREQEWLKKVRIISTTQPLLAPSINSDVFKQVSNALYANKWLTIDYENVSKERKTIKVMPLGLAQQGARLYLVCRYENYDNERSLALHRMKSAKASTLDFKRPEDFDLEKYDNDGRFGFGEGQRIQLSFKISHKAGAHLLETPLSHDQQVKKLEQDYQITAIVVDTEQLTWWLRGFGDAVSDISKCPL